MWRADGSAVVVMPLLGGLSADLGALAAMLGALLHDLGVFGQRIAHLGAGLASLGVGLVSDARKRTVAAGQGGGHVTERLTIDGELDGLGVLLGVPLAVADLLEAMGSGLVAELGALFHDLDMIVVRVDVMIVVVVRQDRSASDGDGRRAHSQRSQ